jgi:hypothetical protein
MTGPILHIPTGRLIHENEGNACEEVSTKNEKSVLDVVAPDGRSIFSIRKLIGEVNSSDTREQHDGQEQIAA